MSGLAPDHFTIESLDLNGQGVAHNDGKVVFVAGALPGERVRARVVRHRKNHDRAQLEEVLQPSSLRVAPECEYFGVCGGCSLQHLDSRAQVAIKQRVLEDNLHHLGNVRAEHILPPIYGPSWGYRYRARLSVRLVVKKGGVLIGFRERQSRYVADMTSCLVLPAHVSALLPALRKLIGSLSCPDRIPQLELAVGEETTVFVLRHLEPLTDDDHALLVAFGQRHGISWWLQPKGPDTVHPLIPGDEHRLYYSLPQYGLTMRYRPTDFTQVNHQINRNLVARALTLLDVQPHHRVADMFCGLGNFTLPLATLSEQVVGVEGAATLVQRAHDLAASHHLEGRTQFFTKNLFEADLHWLNELGAFDRMLIDPPRAGAVELAKALSSPELQQRPERLVMVSCNPATLARDAGILVNVGGYRLRSAGVINMFPHTSHIESMAVFDATSTMS